MSTWFSLTTASRALGSRDFPWLNTYRSGKSFSTIDYTFTRNLEVQAFAVAQSVNQGAKIFKINQSKKLKLIPKRNQSWSVVHSASLIFYALNPVPSQSSKFCAQHRPLTIDIKLPTASWSTYGAEKALGAAYWRSDAVKQRSFEIFELLDLDDPLTFDPVRSDSGNPIAPNWKLGYSCEASPCSFLQFSNDAMWLI